MGSLLTDRWAPPRIRGDVPDGYAGPVYYRALTVGHQRGPKSLPEYVIWDKGRIDGLDRMQIMASVFTLLDARRRFPVMFESDGAVKDAWLAPIKARRKAGFPRRWRHLDPGYYICSQWVRDAVEALDPGAHLFVPVDLTGGEQADERLYVLKFGIGGMGFVALAPLSNPGQDYFGVEALRRGQDFAWLAPGVVGGRHLIDCEVGLVWSQALIDRIGDVFSDNVVLVPMGLAEE